MPTLLLTLALLQAAPNAELARAEALFQAYKYDDTLAALKKAQEVPGNDRPTLLRILELRGVCAGQQRQAKVAEAAFQQLLVLAADFNFTTDYAPRVMTPFLEARRFASEKGSVGLKAAPAEINGGQVHSIGVTVNDPLSMAKAVRFHLQTDAGTSEVSQKISAGAATAAVDATTVRWWAELLGANDATLISLGSTEAPQIVSGTRVASFATPIAPADQLEVRHGASQPVRTASYFLLGGAVVSAGMGIFFGVQSSAASRKFTDAARDGDGRITGITQRQAADLQTQSQQNAVIANVLFIGAGALAIAGALMWWFGAPKASGVALLPGPGGFALVGIWP